MRRSAAVQAETENRPLDIVSEVLESVDAPSILSDRTGKILNEPADTWNHLIDPLRYVAIPSILTNLLNSTLCAMAQRAITGNTICKPYSFHYFHLNPP